MHKVGVHGIAVVEPAFGERVFAVVHVALYLVASCLVNTESIVRDTRIHVPYLTVAALVGSLEILPQLIVRALRMILYHRPERGLQLTAFLAVSLPVVSSAVAGSLCEHPHKHEHGSSKHDVSLSDIHICIC